MTWYEQDDAEPDDDVIARTNESHAATELQFTLAEIIDTCIDIAVRLGNGTDNWTDAPTLLAHLRVIREDFCDA